VVHFPELNRGSNFQISLIQISVTLLQGHDCKVVDVAAHATSAPTEL
jgi:hypothetical protein